MFHHQQALTILSVTFFNSFTNTKHQNYLFMFIYFEQLLIGNNYKILGVKVLMCANMFLIKQ